MAGRRLEGELDYSTRSKYMAFELPGRDSMLDIYTDGSGTTAGVIGWAYCFVLDNEIVGHESYWEDDGTSNRAEMLAVINGLRRAAGVNPQVTVYSDSEYVVNGFNAGWIHNWQTKNWKNSRGRPVANRDLWEQLIDLTGRFESVIFKHVKGHSGNKFNEFVDTLAGEARRNGLDNLRLPM